MLKMFFIVFTFFINSLFATYLSDAKKALTNGKINKAIKLYKSSAREGSDEANFELGKIYYLKEYNNRDLSIAYNYFKKASDYGHVKARYNLAVILGQSKFKKHSYKDSYELFYSLAKQDYANAQYKVGIYLLYGIGVEKDYTMARAWLERAYFENKYAIASCGIASIYANGLGVIQNLGRARKFSENHITKYSLCKKVFYDFKLHKQKYNEDKGFKYGYYK
ncbi:tetratricopeptide repeat protein [Arcobacteraceae bacterium]|nr:tetratricopeptide repeat protein [Arcobacteraceae bacterium]